MGMPVEGMKPGEVLAATGGKGVSGFLPPMGREIFGTQHLKAGDTTDDWQLTRVVAESLIRTEGRFNLEDCARGHVQALVDRKISWGRTTTRAIEDIRDGKRNVLSDPLPPAGPKQGAGNGIMMKIAPIAILHAPEDDLDMPMLWSTCRLLGSITHTDIRASLSAFAVAKIMARSLNVEYGWLGNSVGHFQGLVFNVEVAEYSSNVGADLVSNRIKLIPPVLHDHVALRKIEGYMRFHCMYTVTITIGTFLRHPTDFRTGILEIVNAGGDADSNASILGAMIGANVGLSGIPREWRTFSPEFEGAIELADRLLAVT